MPSVPALPRRATRSAQCSETFSPTKDSSESLWQTYLTCYAAGVCQHSFSWINLSFEFCCQTSWHSTHRRHSCQPSHVGEMTRKSAGGSEEPDRRPLRPHLRFSSTTFTAIEMGKQGDRQTQTPGQSGHTTPAHASRPTTRPNSPSHDHKVQPLTIVIKLGELTQVVRGASRLRRLAAAKNAALGYLN